jgi:hypothetical protein
VHTNDNPTWKNFNRVTIKDENTWHCSKITAPRWPRPRKPRISRRPRNWKIPRHSRVT